jgi:uncharacterized membrane protein YeaQ/YmgE (transglycosylase-associated protein family)
MAVAIFYYFILKKPMLGKFWGAIIVGFIGSFLGGVINFFFKDFFKILENFNNVNVISAVLTALILLWVLSKVSSHK